mmetsp:Transcript_17107/g.53417  ORF Transcript_17107/g.53417 Transcript_17107/m.53417 type:complete len:195 (-) Transcript_17107:46-630(-)
MWGKESAPVEATAVEATLVDDYARPVDATPLLDATRADAYNPLSADPYAVTEDQRRFANGDDGRAAAARTRPADALRRANAVARTEQAREDHAASVAERHGREANAANTAARAPIALQYATARFADGHDSADPAYQRKIAEEDALRGQPTAEDVGDRDIPYEDRDPYASTGGYQPEEYKCADYDCAEYKSVYDK